ncbi:N-acetylglucosaminyltransferase [Sorochytrium milnesiophthora]
MRFHTDARYYTRTPLPPPPSSSSLVEGKTRLLGRPHAVSQPHRRAAHPPPADDSVQDDSVQDGSVQDDAAMSSPPRQESPEDDFSFSAPFPAARAGLFSVLPDASDDEESEAFPSIENKCARGPSYAYVFYVTRPEYLCAALVNAHQLRTLYLTTPDTDIVLLHTPDLFFAPIHHQRVRELNVTLREVARMPSHYGTYRDVLVKLRVWQMTDYTRVIFLDADMLVLRSLDHLFKLRQVELALPRAYWFDNRVLTSLLMVVKPNEETFRRLSEKYIPDGKPLPDMYDMDIINAEFGETALELDPIYGLLDSVWAENYTRFGDLESLLLERAYLAHFSARGKPWRYGRTVQDLKRVVPTAHHTFITFRKQWWNLAVGVCQWRYSRAM